MLSVSVDVDNAGLLDDIRGRLDSRLPLQVLGDALVDYERQAFATRGFGTWDGLDPETIAEKGSSRVLIDNGDLLRELTSPSSLQYSGDTVTLATSQLSALFAKRGARGAPKRDAAPKPTSQHVAGWAEELLGALVTGRR